MIFVKSTLAGVVAVIIAALVIYGLAVGVKAAWVFTASALFQCGRLGWWRFLSFLAASTELLASHAPLLKVSKRVPCETGGELFAAFPAMRQDLPLAGHEAALTSHSPAAQRMCGTAQIRASWQEH